MKRLNTKMVVMIASALVISACANKPAKQPATNIPIQRLTNPSDRGVPQRYLVQRGDTVAKIAARYDLRWRDISMINNLDDNHTIYVGQWLTLWNANNNYHQPNTNTATNNPYSPPPIRQPNVITVKNPTVGSAGVMQFSYPVGKNNRVARNFGTIAKIDGIDTKAKGMWFLGADGDAVTASRNGTVVHADNSYSGASVAISHNNGFVSHYLHVKDVMVQKGQQVKAGDRIASMKQQNNGATVLEFRIARDGVYIDPLTVLR